MEKINKAISEKYPKQKDFADSLGVRPSDAYSKLRTVDRRIKWLKSFLKPLGLSIEVVEIKG